LKQNPFISFFAGLIITSLIIGLISICILFLTFNLAGGETLNQIDGQNVGLFILTIAVLAIAFYFCKKYYTTNKKFTAFGIIITPFFLFIFGIFYLTSSFKTTKFDKVIWTQNKFKPDDMAKSLVRHNTLIGLTRNQVKTMLGQGSEEYGNENNDRGSILYSVTNGWTLSIIFNKDKVVETQMRQPFLGV